MKRFTLATTIMIVITVVAAPFDILVAEEGQAKEPREEHISTAQTTEVQLLLFQVGDKGEPLMIKAQ